MIPKQEYINKAAQALARKVAPVYKLCSWKWVEVGVPTEEEIEKTLLELAKDIINSEQATTSIGAGGLKVERYTDSEGGEDWSFAFSVTETIRTW